MTLEELKSLKPEQIKDMILKSDFEQYERLINDFGYAIGKRVDESLKLEPDNYKAPANQAYKDAEELSYNLITAMFQVFSEVLPDKDEQAESLQSFFNDYKEFVRLKKTGGYVPIFHSKVIDTLSQLGKQSLKEDSATGKYIISKNGVSYGSDTLNTISTSTHKLLSNAVNLFTETNHVGKTRELRNLRVTFTLKDFAAKCKCDINKRFAATPEERAADDKRIKTNLDNFRKKVNKDLKALFDLNATSWDDKVRGKQKDFCGVRIVSAAELNRGVVTIEFSQSFAEYLVQMPLTQYPSALYGIDDRKHNAYAIGLKLCEHFNNDNNQIRNTAKLLRISSLLKVTDLPTIDKVKSQRSSWEDRIKEPFERCLDILIENDVLSDWRYSKSKGEVLTDAEATFTDFNLWESTLLYFELKNPPDHTKRLEARAKEKEENLKKTDKKKAAKKKKKA